MISKIQKLLSLTTALVVASTAMGTIHAVPDHRVWVPSPTGVARAPFRLTVVD